MLESFPLPLPHDCKEEQTDWKQLSIAYGWGEAYTGTNREENRCFSLKSLIIAEAQASSHIAKAHRAACCPLCVGTAGPSRILVSSPPPLTAVLRVPCGLGLAVVC